MNLGIKYLELSIQQNYIDSTIYYIYALMKGDKVPKDLVKANEYISKISSNNDAQLYLLKGKISRKMKKYNDATRAFLEGIKLGDKECMYQYGKMLFLGEGVKKK